MDAPTKSGVLGLLCCSMGLLRKEVRGYLPDLNSLAMGVRIDRPGMRWWDYHTVGAKIGLTTASIKGLPKTGAQGTLITRREYLADASFLVALQGDGKLISDLAAAIDSPKWPVFLGRKSCLPSAPLKAMPVQDEPWTNPSFHDDLRQALSSILWHPRCNSDSKPHNGTFEALMEWRPASEFDTPPNDAEVWYDVPISFDPPFHEPRFVLRDTVYAVEGYVLQKPFPAIPRPRANYTNSEYRKRRKERIEADAGLCVFCKSPGPRMTVQHITYRRAGGNETLEDLRSLCGLCHDAVTMLEYGLGMGLDRINPEDPRWRSRIIQKRSEIINFRSLETRRRLLSAEEA
jgi:hypothetical protein